MSDFQNRLFFQSVVLWLFGIALTFLHPAGRADGLDLPWLRFVSGIGAILAFIGIAITVFVFIKGDRSRNSTSLIKERPRV